MAICLVLGILVIVCHVVLPIVCIAYLFPCVRCVKWATIGVQVKAHVWQVHQCYVYMVHRARSQTNAQTNAPHILTQAPRFPHPFGAFRTRT